MIWAQETWAQIALFLPGPKGPGRQEQSAMIVVRALFTAR